MISQEMLISYIKKAMPDALVTVVDRTGTMDHYRLQIISEAFRGKTSSTVNASSTRRWMSR